MTDKHSPFQRSTSPLRTKRSLTFSSPSSAVSLLHPSLSPAHSKASTDRALTFLQSARDRNVPVRFGKWSREEDAYLAKLIMLFQSGLLAEIETKTSLRSWLAQMLNCCPMRISKKQMHGHQFEGKAKYKRSSSKLDAMTQQQYNELCNELWQLRAEFLKAWAKDEYGKRSVKMRTKESNFNDWYDRVLRLVPTPKIAKRSSLDEYKTKRKIESVDELRREMHNENKKQKVEMLVEIRATTTMEETQDKIKTLEPVEMSIPLEPVPFSFSSALVSSPTISALTPLPTAYCSESGSMSDYWLADFDDRVNQMGTDDQKKVNFKTNEAHYNFCDDQVHVSVHLPDYQNSLTDLSRSHRSSRVVIDYGAPSCWHSNEDSNHTSFDEYSHWMENDMTEETSMSMEPAIVGWADSSPIAHMTYSPTLNFL
ncbi:unnamed protein product [Peronospora destructor]|uniref:Uncharacterized protein n=1 Tax=Peronospora destructor TaxID=86335 RepID=A0AAV0U6F1_9STRA|nr:unnamed protein product [Peronospora destructor]